MLHEWTEVTVYFLPCAEEEHLPCSIETQEEFSPWVHSNREIQGRRNYKKYNATAIIKTKKCTIILVSISISIKSSKYMKFKTTEASIHFKLRIVEPFFWAVSKFLDAPVLIDADISASCNDQIYHHYINREIFTTVLTKDKKSSHWLLKKSHKQSATQHSL